MTQQRRDQHGTEFGEWLRKEHQKDIGSHTFSAQNLDYIWHNYRESWMITIEEKRHGRQPDAAQKDTHGILTQLLQKASGAIVKTFRGDRGVEYRGHYVIIFENTSPKDGRLKINGQIKTEQDLLQLLKTGRI